MRFISVLGGIPAFAARQTARTFAQLAALAFEYKFASRKRFCACTPTQIRHPLNNDLCALFALGFKSICRVSPTSF
jgi:hypothetical protein